METRDGRTVEIITTEKPGMSIFRVFGMLDGKPCHWIETGHYRMDGQEGPRDIVGMPMQEISLAGHEDHMAQSGIRWRGVCPVNCGLPGDQCACFRHLNDTGSKPSDPVMIHLTLPRHAQG